MVDFKLTPASGEEGYAKLVTGHSYYVDKTFTLKDVFLKDKSAVLLITRPRRFGKTLTLDMFKEFLQINYKDPTDLSHHEFLFKDRMIFKDKEFCQNFMGKFPVIFVSFKSIEGSSFDRAYKRIANLIVTLCSKYSFLKQSDALEDEEKAYFAKLCNVDYLRDVSNMDILECALQKLTIYLRKHFNKPCMVLIDEYDVPLAKAALSDYYPQMIELIRELLGNVLKTNSENLQKAVLTGCLRVSKESIFTGLNNLVVNTVFDKREDLYKSIGFTQDETFAMLDYLELSDFKTMVKENYDGYNFANHEMYCAWDVVSFCQDALNQEKDSVSANCYWNHTSSNDIFNDFLGFISEEDANNMQTLVDGGSIRKKINLTMNHADLKNHVSNDFWSLLVYSGYLTVGKNSSFDVDHEDLELRIPNKSILSCFRDQILWYFTKNTLQVQKSNSIVNDIFNKKPENLKETLYSALQHYISVRDRSSNSPKEYYYHGFLNGYFAASSTLLSNYASNKEAGAGFCDISFTSPNGKIAVIIEVKQTDDITQRENIATEALDQIYSTEYYQPFMDNPDITSILCYGICFHKKSCSVKFKEFTK